MLPGMEMMACPNLAVSPEVMQHIVQVESGANPFAIGVVNGQLVRQPKTMEEALATVQMLESEGYNFSVGIAQVNRSNLGRYGLDSYKKAFSVCDNLAAGAQILSRCYNSAGDDWGKAFSCYYSGNFTTGFRDGYVQKIYASINREAARDRPVVAHDAVTTRAIPLVASSPVPGTAPTASRLRPVAVYPSGSAQYRVALRSIAIDTAAAAITPLVVGRARHSDVSRPVEAGAPNSAASVSKKANPNAPASSSHVMEDAAMAQEDPTSSPAQISDGVFEPRVRGPNDPPGRAATLAQWASKPIADHADLRLEHRDASFVF